MEAPRPAFLQDRSLRLLLFGGKGGVGKTTCATAAALHLARNTPDDSFCLVSTDPAHSVADSLAGSSPPANLTVLELDAQECLDAFKAKHNPTLREIASRGTFLDDDDISQFLDLSLPGLDELMGFFEISQWIEKEAYQCIVMDTAPTGHTLRLLWMPELIQKWLGALDALLAKHRYMKKLFSGSYQRDELDVFLEDLALSVRGTELLLRDPVRCRFVPVAVPEAMSLSETITLVGELQRICVPISEIVLNKIYPINTCLFCANERARQMKELGRFSEELTIYQLWGIPLYAQEMRSAPALEAFWTDVTELKDAAGAAEPQVETSRGEAGLAVEGSGGGPSPDVELLLFAGKGGVGKTTLACATALRLAQEREGVLLFSTDPAHSLSDCLALSVGPTPTQVGRGLAAMEINAQAEFGALKQLYAEELSEFLGSLLPNLDLAYDREVMERVLDLSPPGLDEVMALTQVMSALSRREYDAVVLDAAPTGHLIRLLDLPEILDQWLKVFFGLFLKYKRIFRLPRVSQRLVEVSKDLKHLRALLADAERSALYAVAIPTEMAFEETQDLVSACDRIGIRVPTLFLNLATPAGDCDLCAALNRSETEIRGKFSQRFSDKHQTVVYRQTEPVGLPRLESLGHALYEARR